MSDKRYEVVYWSTGRVCATYDTREEALSAVEWYESTYGPFGADCIGVREVRGSLPQDERHGNAV